MVAFPDSKHKSEVLGRPQCITLNRLVTPAQVHFLLSVSLSQSKEMSWETLAIIYQFIHRGCFITTPPHVTRYRKGRWGRKYISPWNHTHTRVKQAYKRQLRVKYFVTAPLNLEVLISRSHNAHLLKNKSHWSGSRAVSSVKLRALAESDPEHS